MGLPHGAPKATKIAPRRVLDRLGSLLFVSRFSLRFLIAFGFIFVPFLVAKWSPWGGTELGAPPLPWGPKPVIWSSWCGSLFDLRPGFVLEPSSVLLGAIFGRSWCHFRPSWDPFSVCGCRLGTFLLVDVRFHLSLLRFSTFDFVDAALELGPADCELRD